MILMFVGGFLVGMGLGREQIKLECNTFILDNQDHFCKVTQPIKTSFVDGKNYNVDAFGRSNISPFPTDDQ